MPSSVDLLPLAHAGEGAAWQALLTLLALGLVAVFVLVVAGRVKVDEPGDLILPLAATAVLASLSGATSATLSDWVGWAFPLGVVALVSLLVMAFTPIQMPLVSPVTAGVVGVAVIAAVLLQAPISRAWHPETAITPDGAPLTDLALEITAPEDDGVVPAGTVAVVVRATGGTLGTTFLRPDIAPPGDPEELVGLTITVFNPATGEQVTLAGTTVEDCSAGCTEATYEVDVDPGEWTIFVEAKTADVRPFIRGEIPLPTASVTVTATEG